MKKRLLLATLVFVMLFCAQLITNKTDISAATDDVKVMYGTSTSARHYINEQSGTTSDKLTFKLKSSLGTVKSQKWTSSNTSVAKVTNAIGSSTKLTMGSEGTAVITLTVTSSKSKTYTEKIFVSSWIDVEDSTVTSKASPTYFFRGPTTGTYETASNKGSVAVGKTLYITRRCGSFYYVETRDAKINFSDDTNKGFVRSSDLKILVNSLSTTKGPLKLEMHEAATLSKLIAPSYATNASVKWSSSNSYVASVDQDGFVLANHMGEATITLSLADGSKSATCKIQVVAENDGTNNLNVKPYDAKEIRLSWTSSPAVLCYQIYRSTSKDKAFDLISTQYDPSTNSYTDSSSDLKPGTEYYYKVLFCYKNGYVFTKLESTILRHTIDEYSMNFCNSGEGLCYLQNGEYKYNNLMLATTKFDKRKEIIESYLNNDTTPLKWEGSCYGMATFAALLSEQDDFKIQDFSKTATKNSELKLTDKNDFNLSVKDIVEVLQISQGRFTSRIEDHLDELRNMNKTGDIFILGLSAPYTVGDDTKYYSHAVLAYGFEEVSENNAKIYIYDPNHPNEERFITLAINDDEIVDYYYHTDSFAIDNYNTIPITLKGGHNGKISLATMGNVYAAYRGTSLYGYNSLKKKIVNEGVKLNTEYGTTYKLVLPTKTYHNGVVCYRYVDYYAQTGKFNFWEREEDNNLDLSNFDIAWIHDMSYSNTRGESRAILNISDLSKIDCNSRGVSITDYDFNTAMFWKENGYVLSTYNPLNVTETKEYIYTNYEGYNLKENTNHIRLGGTANVISDSIDLINKDNYQKGISLIKVYY